jgi:uncharacterized membrane protein
MSALSEKRAELDLQVNMLAEQKAAKTLELLEHIAQQLDVVYERFNYKTDPEIQALKVSPEPHEVLKVMEDAVEEESKEVAHEIKQTVKDITGEVEAVQDEVDDMDKEVKRVASDMREVKEEIRMRSPEQV